MLYLHEIIMYETPKCNLNNTRERQSYPAILDCLIYTLVFLTILVYYVKVTVKIFLTNLHCI